MTLRGEIKGPGEYAGKGRAWCGLVLLFVWGVLAVGATGQVAEAGGEELAALKKAIIAKNVFRPARVAPRLNGSGLELPAQDLGPQRLVRRFKVMAFDRTAAGPQAYVHFENPAQDRKVTVGDVIETIRIVDIQPPYLRCDYAGREVRIAVGESSDDAWTRLQGFGSTYQLKGTTIGPEGTYAYFYFPSEGVYRWVEEGDVLGRARVQKIKREEVNLKHEDGYDITVKTTTTSVAP